MRTQQTCILFSLLFMLESFFKAAPYILNILQFVIIVMYKPTLKRSQLFTQSKQQKPIQNPVKKVIDKVERVQSDSLMISSRLLDMPSNKGKAKKAVLAPLFAQYHSYPPSIAKILSSNEDQKKCIGGYKEINWISTGKKVEFWITGETTTSLLQFSGDASYIAVGELRSSTLPLRIRSHYILAVGIKNEVSLYCLESFSLRIWDTGIKYTLAFSWQIQRILFIDGYKLIFFSVPNCIQIVELGDSERIIQTVVPFYRKYLPTNFSQPKKIVENLLYFRNRIYILFTEIKERLWLFTAVRKLVEQKPINPYIQTKVIESYSIGDGIRQLYKITEEDLKRRIQNYAPGWKSNDLKIQNIFIDNQRDEQLGIVTACGTYITLRDMGQVYFSKDPAFLQNTLTYQSSFLLSETTPFLYNIDKENQPYEVAGSLGYNNLNLTNDSLLWAGTERVDGVHWQNLIAEILLRRTSPSECYLFSNSQWAVFTQRAFYTVRQLPIRHFLIAIIYVNITQLDDYEPLSSHNTSYKKMMERIEQALTPQRLLKYLIQIIMAGERHISVNSIVLELVQRQLKGQVAKSYRDWGYQLKSNLVKKDIQVTTGILSKVWNLIFTLQYRELPVSVSKSRHICDCSAYWLAVHEIYYDLISPLFRFTPNHFKANRELIENTFHSFTSLQNFFELKFKHQNLIRQTTISKISRESFGDDMSKTDASFDREINDISWVEEAACRTITSKIMSEDIIQVHERLKKAVTQTLNFMKIYFGLSNNAELNLPTFSQILRSKSDQQILAKAIIKISDFSTLVDIDNKLPQLELRKDIDFKRWANRMKMEYSQDYNVNIQELAAVINSNYFEDSLKLMGNRFDLQIKMLEIYEQIILSKRESLIQTNTLKQRHFLNNTLFPEDEQTALSNQRQYLNTQLQRIIEEEKKCLQKATAMLTEEKQAAKWSKIMDELIMIAANKPSLYDHLENQLKIVGNLEKFSKLQKLKYKQYHRHAYNKKISLRHKPVERELFSQP